MRRRWKACVCVCACVCATLTQISLPTTYGHMAPHTSRMMVCMAQLRRVVRMCVGGKRWGGGMDVMASVTESHAIGGGTKKNILESFRDARARMGCAVFLSSSMGIVSRRTLHPSARGSAGAHLGPPSCCVCVSCRVRGSSAHEHFLYTFGHKTCGEGGFFLE